MSKLRPIPCETLKDIPKERHVELPRRLLDRARRELLRSVQQSHGQHSTGPYESACPVCEEAIQLILSLDQYL